MSVDAAVSRVLEEAVPGEAPLLESLLRMHVDVQRESGLDSRTILLCRIAALVALDASRESYLVNLALAGDAGVTAEDVRGVLIALGPLVGSARTVSAAEKAIDVAQTAGRM